MKEDPDIVKELREEEKNGDLKYHSQANLKYVEKKSTPDTDEDSEENFFSGGYKKRSDRKELFELENKYQTIFENFTVAITLADEKERIISWNKYTEELLNMNEKDLFLRHVSTLYPKEEWNKIRELDIRKKGMKHKMETKLLNKRNKSIDVELSLCVLKGRNDKTVGSVGIIKDISKLKNIENRLIESEEKYKTIFENSAVAIMLTDENERLISWNKYTEELFQMNEDELHFKPIHSFYPSEEWDKIRKENVRKKGMQHHLETRMFKNNFELFDADISLSIIKNHNGKIIGSIGIIKDISLKKEIEKNLSFNNSLLRSLLENIPDCIYFKDKYGKYIKVNKAKAEQYDIKPSEMIGKKDNDFMNEFEAKQSQKEDKDIINKGVSIINKVEELTDKNGNKRWVSVTKTPWYDKNGKIIGVLGINRNITQIKKSEERFRNFFENAIDPIILLDKNGKLIDMNQQVTKILGYTKKELIGKQFDKIPLLTEDTVKIAKKNFINRIKGESVPPYEVKIITNKQQIIPAEINANALYDDGKVIADLVIIRDLRERLKKNKIEKELIESEKKFEDIFNSTSDFLIYLEKNIILDINQSAIQLGNIKKDEIIGQKINCLKQLFSPEDLKKHTESIKKVYNKEEINDYETELNTVSGYNYKFLFSIDTIKDEDKIKGILLRGKDITQRQRAFDELVKLEERYRVLAETSADGVITIDPLGRLTYVNPSYEKMCKRRKSQILATLFRDQLSEDSVYFFQQLFIDARKNNDKIENVELELCNQDGSIIPIEVNMAPYTKNNEFAGMVCTIRDITERRQVEDELKKSERLKTEFMNIAAHELKSPVTPIKGYLDLIISDKDTNENIKNWAKISLRNAERLLGLVNDILDVSRLDTDTMRFDMEKIDTKKILNELVEDMKAAVEHKNLKFNVKIPKDLPQIMGDKHRLSQVFKNLLVNALKFTDNGYININVEKKPDFIQISVKDSGIGISKNEVKKVFNKFYQAYTGDDRKNEGTGLGLFICKEIIKKHNGDIWVESNLGKGSEFFIKLPYLHKMVLNKKNT